ncbi:hypothetical protein [uncultured Nostoc sp.]
MTGKTTTAYPAQKDRIPWMIVDRTDNCISSQERRIHWMIVDRPIGQ